MLKILYTDLKLQEKRIPQVRRHFGYTNNKNIFLACYICTIINPSKQILSTVIYLSTKILKNLRIILGLQGCPNLLTIQHYKIETQCFVTLTKRKTIRLYVVLS